MNNKSTWLLWLKIFGILGLVLMLFVMLTTVTVLFVPFMCAIVLNVVFSPLVAALERRDVTHERAVLICLLALGLVLGTLIAILPGYVSHEVDVVQAKWPETKAKIDKLLLSAENAINSRVPDENRVDLVHEVPKRIKHATEGFVAELPGIVGEGVVAILLIPLFTYFLLRDGRGMKKSLVAAVPNRYFEMTLSILYRVNQQVGNYLRGLLMEASADTVVAFLLCTVFGIPNAIIIAFVAGATTIAPLAGLVVALVVCPFIAIFSTTGDPLTMLMLVMAAIALTHLIDNVVVAPLIMGHSVHMHPAAVIVSIIVAGKLFGVLGIILAVPAVSVLRVLVQEGYQCIRSYEYFLKNS